MRIKSLIVLSIIAVCFAGCRLSGVKGSGHIEKEIRDVEGFSEIELGGMFEVYVEVGKDYSCEIKADDNLLKYITTKVRGNKLIIDSKKNLNPRKGIKINITLPVLNAIEASGASTITAYGIDSDYFNLSVSGAGSIELDGKADTFKMDVSGAGSVDAEELIAKEVYVNLSGAGSADVYAEESLDADVSGVGSVNYYGNPDDVTTDISGIGSITRK